MGRALTRFYRLLHVLHGDRERLLLAIDWTEWHHEWRLLVAAVVVGWRAIPLQAAAFSRTQIPRSQHLRETTCLRWLVHTLRTVEQNAVVLCDRGLRRVRWREHLLESRQAFAVRLVPDVRVTTGSGGSRLLRAWHLPPGQAVDMGVGHRRQDRAVQVRVVGVGALGPQEPWWLATDLPAPLVDSVALDDRQMTVEEQFRDTKGFRFGIHLEWTPFRTPQYLARLLLRVGVALGLWTAVGQAVAEQRPAVCLCCKHTGPRLSVPRVGIDDRSQYAPQGLVTARFIQRNLPRPQLRRFTWLQATEAPDESDQRSAQAHD